MLLSNLLHDSESGLIHVLADGAFLGRFFGFGLASFFLRHDDRLLEALSLRKLRGRV